MRPRNDAKPSQGEFEVFTEDLCRTFHGCEKCPGHARASEWGLTEEAGDPDEIVFGTHWCYEEGGLT
jgi:hypothetical protein